VKQITPPKKPLPNLEVNTRVFVWDHNNKETISSMKFKRYFSHFASEGNIHCFASGATSWSSGGKTTQWEHWELAE